MKTKFAASIGFVLATVTISNIFAMTSVVPGTSDPWLAGMTNGAQASQLDVAPDESPVQVLGVPVTAGGFFTFSAFGGVSYGPLHSLFGPEGDTNFIQPHIDGAENGIASCTAPVDGLVGVFLGPDLPSLTPAPVALDFTTPLSRDYTNLAPELKQVFYIGDGRRSDGAVQEVIVPAGATRLFLGVMDGFGWLNNQGSFTVEVVGADLPRLDIRVSQVELCWNTVTNNWYQLQYRSTLTSNLWTPLDGTWVTGTGARYCTNDTVLLGQPQRFYRLAVTNRPPQ